MVHQVFLFLYISNVANFIFYSMIMNSYIHIHTYILYLVSQVKESGSHWLMWTCVINLQYLQLIKKRPNMYNVRIIKKIIKKK